MAIESGFYTGQAITAELLNTAFAGVISNGVRAAYTADELQVVANTNMLINIKQGYAVIEGSMLHNTDNYTLTVETADGTLDRIDRVVARQDKSTSPVTNKILIIKGTLSDTPVAPNLVRDGTYYDLGLATISVPAGTTEITDALITDTRFDNDVCGAFFCLAENIDTTKLFTQFQASFKKLIEDMGESDHVDVTVNSDAVSIDDKPIVLTDLMAGQALVFNGTNFVNGTGGLTEKDVFAFCPEGTTEIPDQISNITWYMTKVYVPDSVTTIGNYFMAYDVIKEFLGGKNITTFGTYAFTHTKNITNISLLNVITFGDWAFYDCAVLTELSLPSVTTWGCNFCYQARKLETINMPNVTKLGSGPFQYCDKLTNINFGGRSNAITLTGTIFLKSDTLTPASFLEVANALVDNTGGDTSTIYVKSVAWANVPQSTKDIFSAKNYTISES